ncbi:hypothetical protein [Deinococcus phoenicis]|nr:hypothetical protein [Deinococcus phoenicis]
MRGLSQPSVTTLRALRRGCTLVSEVAAAGDCRPETAYMRLKALRAIGYVERDGDTYRLTWAGQDALQRHDAALYRRWAERRAA